MIIRTATKAHFKTSNNKIITLKKKKGNIVSTFHLTKEIIKIKDDILISKMIPKHMQHTAKQAIFYHIETKNNILFFQKLSDIFFIISNEKDKFKKINFFELNVGDEIICLGNGKFEDDYYFDEITNISIIEDNIDNNFMNSLSNYFLYTEENKGLIINNILVV